MFRCQKNPRLVKNMSLLVLLLILAAMGVAAYFINASQKINSTFKWFMNLVLIVVAALLILEAFGVWDQVKSVKVPRL